MALGLGVAALAACAPASDGRNAASGEQPATGTQSAASTPPVLFSADKLLITSPEVSTLAFGTSRELVERELSKVLGAPVGRDANDECGAGPMESSNYTGGLVLNFQQSKLVGWELRGGDALRYQTDKALAPGDSKADLLGKYAVTGIPDSTLGDEFTSAEGVGGFLEGQGAQAHIASLHAGVNCFFR